MPPVRILMLIVLGLSCATGLVAGEPKLPTAPGPYKLRTTIPIGTTPVEIPYALFLPKAYAKGARCPMLVFLHGVGEMGNDHGGLFLNGPDRYLRDDPALRQIYPFIQLSPQSTGRRWDDAVERQAVTALIRRMITDLKADPERIYLTGLSMGGMGVWRFALDAPDLFAAINPISAVAIEPQVAPARLKGAATWIIAGGADGGFTEGSKQMAAAFERNGNTVNLSVVPGAGHLVWEYYYPNGRFYAWFLNHRRGAAADAKPDAATQAAIDALMAHGKPLPKCGTEALVSVGTSRGETIPAERLKPGGLVGAYFQGTSFDKVIGDRLDRAFAWPDTTLKTPNGLGENFSVRWSGLVRADKAGTYVFHGTADDGQRLRIGKLAVIDNWVMQGPTTTSGAIDLTPGWHPITIEFMQGTGGSHFELVWQGPGFAKRPIAPDELAMPVTPTR